MFSRIRFGSASGGWIVSAILAAALISVLTTLGVDALTHSGEIEVRVNAFRRANGDVVFALQQRQPTGDWSERQEPRANRLVASHSGRWANSTPVAMTWEVEIEQDERVLAIVPQKEVINGLVVEVDRYLEVETVQPETAKSANDGGGVYEMESGGILGNYTSFCSHPERVHPDSYIDRAPSRALVSALYANRNRTLTSAEWLPQLDLEITVWASVTPPAEFAVFHNAMLSGLRSVREAHAQRDPNEIAITTGPNRVPELFLDKRRRTEWSSSLPEDVIRLAKLQGCIEAPEHEGGILGW